MALYHKTFILQDDNEKSTNENTFFAPRFSSFPEVDGNDPAGDFENRRSVFAHFYGIIKYRCF